MMFDEAISVVNFHFWAFRISCLNDDDECMLLCLNLRLCPESFHDCVGLLFIMWLHEEHYYCHCCVFDSI